VRVAARREARPPFGFFSARREARPPDFSNSLSPLLTTVSPIWYHISAWRPGENASRPSPKDGCNMLKRIALWLLLAAIGMVSIPWGALQSGAGLTECKQGLCRCAGCVHHKVCDCQRTGTTILQSSCTCDRSPILFVSPLPAAIVPKLLEMPSIALDAIRFRLNLQSRIFNLNPPSMPPRLA